MSNMLLRFRWRAVALLTILGVGSASAQSAIACTPPLDCRSLAAQGALRPSGRADVGGTLMPLAPAPAGSNRWKIGALLGGVIGGATFGHLCQRDGCMTGVPIVIGVAGGAALGAVIGKLLGLPRPQILCQSGRTRENGTAM